MVNKAEPDTITIPTEYPRYKNGASSSILLAIRALQRAAEAIHDATPAFQPQDPLATEAAEKEIELALYYIEKRLK